MHKCLRSGVVFLFSHILFSLQVLFDKSNFTLEALERPGTLLMKGRTLCGLLESVLVLFDMDILYLKSEHFFGITLCLAQRFHAVGTQKMVLIVTNYQWS